jgi:cell wall-associated NlpC family hydrolase
MKTFSRIVCAGLLIVSVQVAADDLSPVVRQALRLVGTPYQYGAAGKAKDCSAFTQACFRQIGVRIPRTSREQFTYGQPVPLHLLRGGDLVFWKGRKGISHVGLYLGKGYVAHSTSLYGRVVVEPLEAVNRRNPCAGARRVLGEPSTSPPERGDSRTEGRKGMHSRRKTIWSRTRSFLKTILRTGR